MENSIETLDLMNQEPETNPVTLISDIVTETEMMPSEEEEKVLGWRKTLAETLITTDTEVEPEQFALSVDNTGFFAIGDIHGVKAKQKQGKTTALKVCAAALMNGQQFRVKSELAEPKVLWIDTEQKRSDVKLILTDIMTMTGLSGDYINSHLHVHAMRSCNYDELYQLMLQAIKDFEPQVVIVDGIVEFVASFNDESIAKQLVHDLQVLSQDCHCAVVCVLHTNKADEDHNMRGHLGTMLAQKAGTVLECRKQNKIITIVCTESRHAEVPEWSICFDESGNINDAEELRKQWIEQHKAELQKKRQEETERKMKERLDYAIHIVRNYGGCISRKQLTEELMKKFELKRPTVSSLITQWQKEEALFEVNGMIHDSQDTALPF